MPRYGALEAGGTKFVVGAVDLSEPDEPRLVGAEKVVPTTEPEETVAGVAGAVTVAGMIATPLLPQGGRGRRVLSSVVVVGSFVTTTANATRRWGPRRAFAAAGVTAAATTGPASGPRPTSSTPARHWP